MLDKRFAAPAGFRDFKVRNFQTESLGLRCRSRARKLRARMHLFPREPPQNWPHADRAEGGRHPLLGPDRRQDRDRGPQPQSGGGMRRTAVGRGPLGGERRGTRGARGRANAKATLEKRRCRVRYRVGQSKGCNRCLFHFVAYVVPTHKNTKCVPPRSAVLGGLSITESPSSPLRQSDKSCIFEAKLTGKASGICLYPAVHRKQTQVLKWYT